MEIKLQGTAIPCVAQQAIVAGLAVKLTPALGKSSPDVVQGALLPTAGADTDAHFVAAFRVYNEKPPLYETLPTLDETGNTTSQPYTLRGFIEGSENLPADVTLRMVVPRLKEEETIVSGALMLAYDDGIYAVTSGCFTYSDNLAVGNYVTCEAGGKWAYTATASEKTGVVFEYSQANATLTVKTGQ